MTRPPPTPESLPFPVYGLSAGEVERRWLGAWNAPDYVSTVTLGHDMVDGGFVAITSIRKAPRPPLADTSISTEPYLASAALSAVVGAVEAVWLDGPSRTDRKRRNALLDAELARIDSPDTCHDVVVLVGWDEVSVDVDGTSTPGRRRGIGDMWAIVLELDDVIIAASGEQRYELADFGLVDMRDRMEQYPWPSIRDHKDWPTGIPRRTRQRVFLPLSLGLRDMLANARDEQTDARELLARIEHVAYAMLQNLSREELIDSPQRGA